jgi:hypothetical protein
MRWWYGCRASCRAPLGTGSPLGISWVPVNGCCHTASEPSSKVRQYFAIESLRKDLLPTPNRKVSYWAFSGEAVTLASRPVEAAPRVIRASMFCTTRA